MLLATVLQKQLCPFDELAQLDPALYKNLTYVKHYKDSDDVSDLELTFSTNEEFLGKVCAHVYNMGLLSFNALLKNCIFCLKKGMFKGFVLEGKKLHKVSLMWLEKF